MYDDAPFARIELRENISAFEATVVNQGFSVYEDRPTKPGLIATEIGSQVSQPLCVTVLTWRDDHCSSL
jgi:hypothetical protein